MTKTETSKRRVVVLLPMVWSVRNVVYSGVLETLAAAGLDVHLLLKRCPPAATWERAEFESFRRAASCLPIQTPPSRRMKGLALLQKVRSAAFQRRHRTDSYEIYRDWFDRHLRGPGRLRSQLIEALAKVFGPRAPYRALDKIVERLYRRSHNLRPIREQLKLLAPDVIWSTVCVSSLEYPYILAARDLGIPIVSSILSFDNLTSRGEIPRFDHYLVWNGRMKEQLRQFYPDISPAQITITGTPQFDFHRRPAFAWPRAQTIKQLGMPEGARYVLYTSSHESLAPAEPRLVEQLIERMGKDETLKELFLLLRLHPLDDRKRWEKIGTVSDKVIVASAWENEPEPDGWTLSSPTDQARLVSTLKHAEACINVASTVTLDAAAMDRPVIGIEFSREPESVQDILYKEYEADHYRPLVQSGGLRLAHSWAELFDLLRAAVETPERDRERRAQMVARECGEVDGRSAERVAGAILRFLEEEPSREFFAERQLWAERLA